MVWRTKYCGETYISSLMRERLDASLRDSEDTRGAARAVDRFLHATGKYSLRMFLWLLIEILQKKTMPITS
ncbi:hypothetical protein LQV63_15750 [Paenibacillus profundus]|uniref:Uncharacterized protein n=1 Tax=Paenibacillus profundus TaxID=1173085 RepID=A0ABS8YK76_9BACL|nr:hypothetical protein [Paenibacillus profundus]